MSGPALCHAEFSRSHGLALGGERFVLTLRAGTACFVISRELYADGPASAAGSLETTKEYLDYEEAREEFETALRSLTQSGEFHLDRLAGPVRPTATLHTLGMASAPAW